jgi:hypothetical protein
MNQCTEKIFRVRDARVWILFMKKVLKIVGNAILLAKPVNLEMDQINALLVMIQTILERLQLKITMRIRDHANALQIVFQFILLKEMILHVKVIIL